MGMFNWFGESEHRVFNYKPRYYDPAEEERKRRFRDVDGSVEREKKEGKYVPGSHIQGAFRDGRYSRTRSHSNKVQNIIGIIGLLLVVTVLIFIAKFYSLF